MLRSHKLVLKCRKIVAAAVLSRVQQRQFMHAAFLRNWASIALVALASTALWAFFPHFTLLFGCIAALGCAKVASDCLQFVRVQRRKTTERFISRACLRFAC
jgi:hypothetical protein